MKAGESERSAMEYNSLGTELWGKQRDNEEGGGCQPRRIITRAAETVRLVENMLSNGAKLMEAGRVRRVRLSSSSPPPPTSLSAVPPRHGRSLNCIRLRRRQQPRGGPLTIPSGQLTHSTNRPPLHHPLSTPSPFHCIIVHDGQIDSVHSPVDLRLSARRLVAHLWSGYGDGSNNHLDQPRRGGAVQPERLQPKEGVRRMCALLRPAQRAHLQRHTVVGV